MEQIVFQTGSWSQQYGFCPTGIYSDHKKALKECERIVSCHIKDAERVCSIVQDIERTGIGVLWQGYQVWLVPNHVL